MSEGLQNHKEKDKQQDDDRHFVEETEPDMGFAVVAAPEMLQQAAAIPVIDGQQRDQRRLCLLYTSRCV